MILEFRVRNFRSFKGENVLSLVGSRDSSLAATNAIETQIPSLPRALRSAVIYGANASGKSNFIRAMQLMRGVVMASAALQPTQTFNVQPFRLDRGSSAEPTLFEITVLLSGIRYQYGFEFTPSRIVSEWLLVYQKSKPQRWFDRRAGDAEGKDKFEFGPHLSGPKRIWQDATRPNALFLSTAVQLNSEALSPLYNWFAESLTVLLEGGHLSPDFSTSMVQTPIGQARIAALLSAADIAISAIAVEPMKSFRQSFNIDPTKGMADSKFEEAEILMPRFTHKTSEISAEFEFVDESQGTQKLFSLAGLLFEIIEKGSILVIDELDRSFHPLLVRKIIETFQNPSINRLGAQLIFTTHDIAQLDSTLLRRDQVWFTEKRRDQSSQLVPLTEFSPRKGEALERGYLEGRYGGVPILANRLIIDSASAER